MPSELERFLGDRENQRLFEQERLILEVTEAISGLLNEKGISRAQLADRLKCSPSNVTQGLDGENNFTIRTIADWLFALDARLSVTVEPLANDSISGNFEYPLSDTWFSSSPSSTSVHFRPSLRLPDGTAWPASGVAA